MEEPPDNAPCGNSGDDSEFYSEAFQNLFDSLQNSYPDEVVHREEEALANYFKVGIFVDIRKQVWKVVFHYLIAIEYEKVEDLSPLGLVYRRTKEWVEISPSRMLQPLISLPDAMRIVVAEHIAWLMGKYVNQDCKKQGYTVPNQKVEEFLAGVVQTIMGGNLMQDWCDQ